MPPALGPTIRAFSAEAKVRLEVLGWHKRAGEVYTFDHGECLGWLGLNRATKYEPLQVNPVVGVRHQQAENRLAQLMGRKAHSYIPPTVSTPARYLSSVTRPTIVVCDVDDAPRAADELARLVQVEAMSFVDDHLSIGALIRALEEDYLSLNPVEYCLPVLLTLSGEVARASEVLSSAVAARSERDDPEADQYRAFAVAAEQWIRSA